MNVYIGGTKSYSAMQGPAPEGFHVPLQTEWEGLKTIMNGLSLTTGDSWRINLHMPFTGYRIQSTSAIDSQGVIGRYWSSSPYGADNPSNALSLILNSSSVLENYSLSRSFGFSVRPFKDGFVTPDSSWTVIQGTLESAGIFRDTVNGLISITGDGATGYTIADKNLGATTVYSDGDTLSEANCGKYYQWGNNYGFPRTGSVTTSSTKVNASNYGPGNYYSSSTFITGSADWSSVHNDNLRGGVTGIVSPAELRNAYIGEYPQLPTDGMLVYYPLTSDANDHKADLGVSGTTYNGTWGGTANYGTVGGKTAALFSRGSNRISTGFSRSSAPITICAFVYETNPVASDWQTAIGNSSGNNQNGYAIRLVGVNNSVRFNNGTGSDKTVSNMSSNEWHSLILTIKSGESKLYIDGVLAYTDSTGSNASGGSFYIASYGTYTTYGFNGYIRNVAIYNRILSADEAMAYNDSFK